MKLFSKKQSDNLDDLFDIENSNFSTAKHEDMLLSSNNDQSSQINKPKPFAITTDEVISKKVATSTVKNNSSALEALKKRMEEYSGVNKAETVSVKNNTDIKQNKLSETKENKYDTSKDLLEYINEVTRDMSKVKSPIANSNTVSKSEIKPTQDKIKSEPIASKIEVPPTPIQKTVESDKKNCSPEIKPNTQSLLERCKPYILDDNGNDTSLQESQSYRLDSIADILSSQSKNSLDRLSEKYNVTFDDLGHKNATKASPDTATSPKKTDITTPTLKKESANDIVSQIVNSINSAENAPTDIPLVISDVDSSPFKIVNLESNNNATIKFTPVSEDEGAFSRISVSSHTRSLNLSDELIGVSENHKYNAEDEVQLEKDEFDEYTHENEFTDKSNVKKFVRMFSINKRNSFLKTSLTLILGLVLGFLKLPFMNNLILANTKSLMIFSTCVIGIIVLLNIDMFKAFSGLFKKQSSTDINASLASIATLGYCVFGIFANEITLDFAILLAFILFIRALCLFLKDSYMLSNFKQISVSSPKKAIKIISDSAVTFAMAKNATDGDALIAAPQEASHIDDFMKYSTFGAFFGRKLPIINILSVIISIITALACTSYFGGIVYGFYSFAAIQCFASLPILYLIDNLPLYNTAIRLNKMGAMIAGKTGAEHIEMTNAVVLNSTDIFPTGSVTLHDMKMLASNSIDDTLIRAASLTECIGSPLAQIFKTIAGTGNIDSLPYSDTVKYEDKLGISGYVNNKLLFIGNRTLMEAHGITVPSIDVDRKILRKGFFPVYVASDTTACAILIVQYRVVPDIAHELQKISSLGMTLLINNNDPNLNEEMICDYMGLYSDSVKIMSNAGCNMYKNAVTKVNSISAPAAYKENPIAIASIISCANRIKKSNTILSVLYIIFSIIGTVLFTYSSFYSSGTLISCSTVLLYTIICTAVSYLLYLIKKP